MGRKEDLIIQIRLLRLDIENARNPNCTADNAKKRAVNFTRGFFKKKVKELEKILAEQTALQKKTIKQDAERLDVIRLNLKKFATEAQFKIRKLLGDADDEARISAGGMDLDNLTNEELKALVQNRRERLADLEEATKTKLAIDMGEDRTMFVTPAELETILYHCKVRTDIKMAMRNVPLRVVDRKEDRAEQARADGLKLLTLDCQILLNTASQMTMSELGKLTKHMVELQATLDKIDGMIKDAEG